MTDSSTKDRLAAAVGNAVRAPAPREAKVPGEVGIWVFILGDMVAFAVFFGVFLYSRGNDPGLFDESRRHLTVGFAVANTVLLLTSSYFVATAVRAFRTGARRWARHLFVLAIVCGLGFVGNKAIEYGHKLHDDITPATNEFYMYFFVLTGIHLFHVVIGLIFLGVLWDVARRREEQPSDVMVIEVGASYWHLVDLLWIVLFPLLYLVR